MADRIVLPYCHMAVGGLGVLEVCVTAVCGHPANDPGANDICAALVRLYKYLVPSFGDEFGAALRLHVVQHAVRVGGEVVPEHLRADWPLRQLYGEDVFPASLCRLLNVHVQSLQYRASDAVTDATRRGDIFAELIRLTFHFEQKPIITRFFLFTVCVHGVFRCLVLGIPVDIFSVSTKTPGTENSKRLKRLVDFYSRPSTLPDLKKAVLCLRIAMISVALSSKKHRTVEPTLVRLGKRDVQRKSCEMLNTIIEHIHADPALSLNSVVPALLLTVLHVFIRFAVCLEFPVAGWRLSIKYNASAYL